MRNFSSKITLIEFILLSLIFLFPLIIIFRSFALNLSTTLISLIVIYYISKKKIDYVIKNKIIIYLILFFTYLSLNSIINFQSYELVLKSIGNIRYLFLTIGVIFFLKTLNHNQLKKFIQFNLILIILICLDVFLQYLTYSNIFGFKPGMCHQGIDCKRFSGVFNQELIVGAFVSQLGFLILIHTKIFETGKNILKFSQLIFLVLIFFTILISGERSAFIIFCLSIFFYLIFQKKFFSLFLVSALILLSLISTSYFMPTVKERFINITNTYGLCKNCSSIEKVKNNPWSYHYIAAIEIFKKKPFVGHGIKSFRVKCGETKIQQETVKFPHKYKNYKACSTHPHNYMFEFLSEFGLIGFLFYFGLIIIIFYQAIMMIRYESKNDRIIFFGISALILSVLFPFKPSGSFLTTFNASIFFYLLGFFIHYLEKNK